MIKSIITITHNSHIFNIINGKRRTINVLMNIGKLIILNIFIFFRFTQEVFNYIYGIRTHLPCNNQLYDPK